jgi:hypothetical protein
MNPYDLMEVIYEQSGVVFDIENYRLLEHYVFILDALKILGDYEGRDIN